MNNKKARVIAFYLPQFHPTKENDAWWGKGFTEWTNVGKAKPLFKGHYQPRVPADLGYYDLRMPEVREEQAKMAREAGIEGFCYWHYWFGNGKELLKLPFNEVLESGKPDFPFCLGWANHSWSNKTWLAGSKFKKDSVLMEQTYPGKEEHIEHFYALLDAFKDKRYICVDGKPLFVVHSPAEIPDVTNFMNLWRNLAIENGLKGIHFVGITNSIKNYVKVNDKKKYRIANLHEGGLLYKKTLDLGFDAINSRGFWRSEFIVKGRYMKFFHAVIKKVIGGVFLEKYKYKRIIKNFYIMEDVWENVYPTIFPQWDRSPRAGKEAQIYTGSTPELFKVHINDALKIVAHKEDEHKLIFLMSWNEWAEGNYVEPDIVYGNGYLNVLKELINF